MKKWLSLTLLMTLVWLSAVPVRAQANTFTVNSEIPIDTTVFVPCAAGGAGEVVHLSGTIHDLFHITFDSSGGIHVTAQDSFQGVSGVGLTTGDKYQATGVTLNEFNAKIGAEETFVDSFRVIGQGKGNNFLVRENSHITVNANGTVTAFFDNFSIECK